MTKNPNDAIKNKNKLHLGCGLISPLDWINLDGSWNARLAKYPYLRRLLTIIGVVSRDKATIPWATNIFIHDLRKPLPFGDCEMVAVYSSHTLEHLYLSQAQALLKECWRVLAPGGVIRFVVPDLKAIIEEYLVGDKSTNQAGILQDSTNQTIPADVVNQQLLMREPNAPSGNFLRRIYSCMQDFHSHKWMYDTESLIYYFRQAGFVEVQEMTCHNSRIKGIEDIENPGRILDGVGICVEGEKPDAATVTEE